VCGILAEKRIYTQPTAHGGAHVRKEIQRGSPARLVQRNDLA